MTTRIAIAAAFALIAGAAQSQDLSAWYAGVVAEQNGVMNSTLNGIIAANVNDPYVQQMYWQQVQSGLFYGSIEEFAYKYAATGGMTQGGYANLMAGRQQMWSDMAGQNAGFMNAPQVYMDAYGNYVQGYANNQAGMAALWGGY